MARPSASHTAAAAARKAFAAYIVDLMRPFAPVTARAMFGGFGVYRDGLMFALLLDERLYFKVDEQTVGAFNARGLGPFTYESADGKVGSLKYFTAPDEVYEDSQEMVRWARDAYACAVRAQGAKAGRKKGVKAVPDSASGASVEPVASPAGGQGAGRGRHGKQVAPDDVAALPNLGPKSAQMLAAAGLHTLADLKASGAVLAFARVKAVSPQASLNLLWALEGALTGRPWQEVAENDRASLLMALEDVQHHLQGARPLKP